MTFKNKSSINPCYHFTIDRNKVKCQIFPVNLSKNKMPPFCKMSLPFAEGGGKNMLANFAFKLAL